MNYPENRIYPSISNSKSGYDLIIINSEDDKKIIPIEENLYPYRGQKLLNLKKFNSEYNLKRDWCSIDTKDFKEGISLNGYFILKSNPRNGQKDDNSSSSKSSSYERRIEELENLLKKFENILTDEDYENNLSKKDFEIYQNLSKKVHQIKNLKSEISKLEELKNSLEDLDDETKKSMISLIDERIQKSFKILEELSK